MNALLRRPDPLQRQDGPGRHRTVRMAEDAEGNGPLAFLPQWADRALAPRGQPGAACHLCSREVPLAVLLRLGDTCEACARSPGNGADSAGFHAWS